jgi:hypothetical protein
MADRKNRDPMIRVRMANNLLKMHFILDSIAVHVAVKNQAKVILYLGYLLRDAYLLADDLGIDAEAAMEVADTDAREQ